MSETVKPFSDYDLRILSECICAPGDDHAIESSQLRALLARLAAAEDLAAGVRNDSRLSAIYKAEVQKWLKTRGIGI